MAFHLCLFQDIPPLLHSMGSNYFFAQLDVGLTASVGPTWKLGGVSSSEGHCTVGHIHSCSKIRLVGWQRPKGESQCNHVQSSCNHGVVTHLQCCLACFEGGQKTNSFVLCVPVYHLDLRFQKKPVKKGTALLLQLCQNRGMDTRPSHHDLREQTMKSWSGNGA